MFVHRSNTGSASAGGPRGLTWIIEEPSNSSRIFADIHNACVSLATNFEQ